MMVSKKDLIKVMMIGSGVFLVFSVFYAVFLHAQYSGQINGIRLDLLAIKDWYDAKAEKAHGLEAMKYKSLANKAEELAKDIQAPSLNPYAYTYLNYWVSSAAFTQLILTYEELGLDNKTVSALEYMENNGWFGNSSFYIFDLAKGDFVQKLAEKPELEAYFWTYYLAVVLVSTLAVFLGLNEKYENIVVPSIISGTLSLVPFWLVFILGAIISLSLGVLRPENVDFFAYIVSLIITLILSAFGGMIAGLIMKRREEL